MALLLQKLCVNLQRLRVWPFEPSQLSGLALHLQQNPAASLFLMRAGGMYQAFSCFLFSLSPSLFPPTLQSDSVKYLISYFILQLAINFKLFSSHLQWCRTTHGTRTHQLPNGFTISLGAKRRKWTVFTTILHTRHLTWRSSRGNMLLSPSTFMDYLIQFRES